jgi:hypothetical protein
MRCFSYLVLLALTACGSTVTSVDGDAKTSDLSPADQKQLCEDVSNYVIDTISAEDIAKIGCGFSVSEEGDCQQAFQECVAKAPKVTPIADGGNCDGFQKMLEGCNATVDEFAGCIEEMVDALETLVEQFPLCSDEAMLGAVLSLQEEISSECIAMMTKCEMSL